VPSIHLTTPSHNPRIFLNHSHPQFPTETQQTPPPPPSAVPQPTIRSNFFRNPSTWQTHPNNNNIRPTPSRSASYIGTTGFNESASTTPSTMPLRDAQPTTRQDISSDSSDETEEGFVVLGDEFSAPGCAPPNLFHSLNQK
jgi:hypothetical protein